MRKCAAVASGKKKDTTRKNKMAAGSDDIQAHASAYVAKMRVLAAKLLLDGVVNNATLDDILGREAIRCEEAFNATMDFESSTQSDSLRKVEKVKKIEEILMLIHNLNDLAGGSRRRRRSKSKSPPRRRRRSQSKSPPRRRLRSKSRRRRS